MCAYSFVTHHQYLKLEHFPAVFYTTNITWISGFATTLIKVIKSTQLQWKNSLFVFLVFKL